MFNVFARGNFLLAQSKNNLDCILCSESSLKMENVTKPFCHEFYSVAQWAAQLGRGQQPRSRDLFVPRHPEFGVRVVSRPPGGRGGNGWEEGAGRLLLRPPCSGRRSTSRSQSCTKRLTSPVSSQLTNEGDTPTDGRNDRTKVEQWLPHEPWLADPSLLTDSRCLSQLITLVKFQLLDLLINWQVALIFR